MRFYQQQHPFYCGVDLHARSMHVCLVDAAGSSGSSPWCGRIATGSPPRPTKRRCPMFAWYWLADLCAERPITFILGHALYMKAIHDGSLQNDREERSCRFTEDRIAPARRHAAASASTSDGR